MLQINITSCPDPTVKAEICDKVLHQLPRWFGIELSIQEYVQAVKNMDFFIASNDAENTGFLALRFHNEFTAEIHVMAVLEKFHRQGIGRKLIEYVENYLQERRYKLLEVKTLSPSRVNKEYEQTRNFYSSLGFIPLEEIKEIWGEKNPCLIMVKIINSN